MVINLFFKNGLLRSRQIDIKGRTIALFAVNGYYSVMVLNYSIVLMVSTINFYHILYRTHEFYNSILRLGKYPISIYKGLLKTVLSFVIPLAFMYSFPAKVLTGTAGPNVLVYAILFALVFYVISVNFWNRSLLRYESAQG